MARGLCSNTSPRSPRRSRDSTPGPTCSPAMTSTSAPDGRLAIQVLPHDVYDRLLLSGVSAEVWMEPSVSPENLGEHMGAFYRDPRPTGKVALVLGAGNVASIAPLDVLYKLVAEGQVCILKMNPVNEYLGQFLKEAFRVLIDEGFVRVVYGGGDVGAWLCEHPLVQEIHVTGSARTHNAIVFGDGPEGAERKAKDQPKNPRPVTSELGNVSPTIVVPGPWTAADLQFQAEQIATQKMHNAGFNCIAAQVVIVSSDWPQKDAFLTELRHALTAAPDRPGWYPGCDARVGSRPRPPPRRLTPSAPRPSASCCPAWTSPIHRVRLHHRVLRPGTRRRRTARSRRRVPGRRRDRRQRTAASPAAENPHVPKVASSRRRRTPLPHAPGSGTSRRFCCKPEARRAARGGPGC